MNKRGQAEVIGDLIRTIIGVFLLLILIGGTYAIYQAFFTPKLSAGEKDRNLMAQKLESLLPDRSEQVITSCSSESKPPCTGYSLTLYPTGNDEQACNGVACLCVAAPELGKNCEKLKEVATDCKKKEACVNAMSSANVAPIGEDQIGEPVIICRKSNALLIGQSCN